MAEQWSDLWRLQEYRFQQNAEATRWQLLGPGERVIDTGSLDSCMGALAKELGAAPEKLGKKINIPFRTLGGMQFWGDEFFSRGWRIQRNIITGHYRLVDAGSVRRAWGSYEHCLEEYRKRTAAAAPPPSKPLVIFLHGIFRSGDSFKQMGKHLESEGFQVCRLNYPSTQASIPEHAAQVNRLIERLEDVEEIHFVCHSLGGLVARTALNLRPDPRVKRIVTLGTPHKGAIEANMLADWFPYKVAFGPSGQQLVRGSEAFVASLPDPPCPVGCIAGGKGDGKGFSPIIAGDDDGTVGMDSAVPDFAADSMVIDVLHSFLMHNEDAIKATARFLKTGTFAE